jgi:hypothetical protein
MEYLLIATFSAIPSSPQHVQVPHQQQEVISHTRVGLRVRIGEFLHAIAFRRE